MSRLFKFPKRERLRGRENFSRLFQDGKRLKKQGLTLIYLPNNLDHNRVGIALKGIKGAVKRNMIKRKIRELYRLNKRLIQGSFDIIFMPSPLFIDNSFNIQTEIISSVFSGLRLENE